MDKLIKKYAGHMIRLSVDNGDFYWTDSIGCVGGEGFATVDECIQDIKYDMQQKEKWLTNPMAYIGGY